MHPVKQTDHASAALALFAEQFKNKANLEGFMRVWLRQIQDLENFFWQLLTERWIDTAIGAQLDVLGRIVGEPRGNSPNDEFYRLIIRARIRRNMSAGTVEDIYSVFRTVLGATAMNLKEAFPAGFEFRIEEPIPHEVTDLFARFLKSSRAAGVGANLVWQPFDDASTFTYESRCTFISEASIGPGVNLAVNVFDNASIRDAEECTVAPGTSQEETTSLTVLDDYTIVLGELTHAHARGTCVRVPGGAGKGYGDVGNPLTGGAYSGALYA